VSPALLGQRLSESNHPPLRCAVGTAIRISLEPGYRRNINDAPAPALDHVWHRVLCAEERAGQIDRKGLVPFFAADVWNQRRRAGDSRIVDKNIDLPEFA